MSIKYLYYFEVKQDKNSYLKIGETEETFKIGNGGITVNIVGCKKCVDDRYKDWEKYAGDFDPIIEIGKVRYIGVKNYGDKALHKFLEKKGHKRTTIGENPPQVTDPNNHDEIDPNKDYDIDPNKKDKKKTFSIECFKIDKGQLINAMAEFDKKIRSLKKTQEYKEKIKRPTKNSAGAGKGQP